MMELIDYASYFLGGAFLTNAVPHFVSGVTGHPFQSPFAKPHGQGLSSSRWQPHPCKFIVSGPEYVRAR